MKIVYNAQMQARAFKDVLGERITAMLEKRPETIYLDADLMSCIGTAKYAAQHPTRAINCGIAEANMIGVACGLAASGFKPIVHTFGPFASRRCFDQVFLSAGYAGNDITVIGSDPGVTAAYNGGTHMPFEDVALYRTIPTATIMEITDDVMLESVLEQCIDLPGVKYIRVGRKKNAAIFAPGTQTPVGKALVLREGTDAVVFAVGIMVGEAMKAAEELDKRGIRVAVGNPFTIKPLDEEIILRYAANRAVVVAENHSRIGGLYSAIADLLASRAPAAIECVAVEHMYGEVGSQAYLQERVGLTAENICQKVIRAMQR